jgi:hypothetical protein
MTRPGPVTSPYFPSDDSVRGEESSAPSDKQTRSSTFFKPFNTVKDTRGFLYAFKIGDYYKIGFTGNAKARLSHAQVHCPVEVKEVARVYCANARHTETLVHRHLDKFRVRGEWFHLQPAQVDTLFHKTLKWYEMARR